MLHGFTANTGSMRAIADGLAAAGLHVELPLLPGHGTAMDDLMDLTWSDWAGEAEAAYQRLAARTEHVAVVGLSMGGALGLRVSADHPEVVGLVCINPVTRSQPDEVLGMLDAMIDGGTEVMPGVGSDIADPDAGDNAYEGTPLRALRSLLVDGAAALPAEFPTMTMPLLLMTSPQDHVVEPAQSDLLADTYGGPVERISLERSYHVATRDFDRDLIVDATVRFVGKVCAR